MAQKALDSGTPQPADDIDEEDLAEGSNPDPQLVDIARLLDRRKAVPPENEDDLPADAERDVEDSGDDDHSQLAERGDEAPEASDEPDPDAEGAGDATAEDEDDPKPPKGLTPEAQHAFNRVVAKEKRFRRELETKLEESEAELERIRAENAALQLEREPAVEDELPMLAQAKSADEVRGVQAKATRFMDWAEEQIELLRYQPEAVEAELKREGVKLDDYSEEAMAKWLLKSKRNARDVVNAAPVKLQRFERKGQFEAAERKMSAEAEKLIPWLRQPKSPEMEAFNELVRQMPEFKSRPNWKALVAAHVEGLKVLRARRDRAVAASGSVRTASRRPAGDPAPITRGQIRGQRHAAAFSKLRNSEGGSVNEIAALLDIR